MKTEMTIIRPHTSSLKQAERHEVDLPEEPGYETLRKLIEPFIGCAEHHMEHVLVLYQRAKHLLPDIADMFVDEEGMLKNLDRNEVATGIYRAAWLAKHPEATAEELPWICGTAVLFDRIVWT